MSELPKLRLSLTIPGAVSLGSYEGGALAALLIAIQALGEDVVVVDSIAGASAGSMTAVLTAQTLLSGRDPVAMMSQAWVEDVSYDAMKTSDTGSLLSSSVLTEIAAKVMSSATNPDDVRPRQHEPIRMAFSLTNLAGLAYKIYDPVTDNAITAATYQDWDTATVDATTDDAAFQALAQIAIASGSNAMAFPAKWLDRTTDKAAYTAAGVLDFPADGGYWYTDGGTTNNEPLGRTIDLISGIEAADDDHRLLLLVHYDRPPSGATAGSPWCAKDEQPGFARAASRAFGASTSQPLFDDLKSLVKVNQRLDWTEKCIGTISDNLEKALVTGLATDQQDAARAVLAEALQGALGGLRDQQQKAAASADRAAHSRPEPPADVPGLVRALVLEASGLADRSPIQVDVVSPAVGTGDENELAGAFLNHFGGFFKEELRQSDFMLGFRNMQTWIGTTFRHYLPEQVTDEQFATATTALTDATGHIDFRDVYEGGATIASLGLKGKVELAFLAKHVVEVLVEGNDKDRMPDIAPR